MVKSQRTNYIIFISTIVILSIIGILLQLNDPSLTGAITFDCGNGAVETTEACDDGNNVNGDGCTSKCIIEPYYNCEGEPSVCKENM